MTNNDKCKKSNKVIAATMVGGLSGAILGLLLAPKSGQELRQDINKHAHKLEDKAIELKEKAQTAWHTIEDTTEKTFGLSKACIQKGHLLVSNLKTLVSEIRHGTLTKISSSNNKTPEDGDSGNPILEI